LVPVLGILLLAAPGVARAQGTKLIGTVTAIDADAGTLSVAESHGVQRLDLRFDKKSRFTAGNTRKTVRPAEIAPGASVTVLYEADDSGELPRIRHMAVRPPAASGEDG
jgi:hypothetical protein